MRKKKIGLITSRGGHLFQLYQLRDWWKKHDRFWVTFPGKDVETLLKKEEVFFGYFPESRNILNAIRNAFLAIKIIGLEKPDVLISCGAALSVPFFYIGKLFGVRLIFIEPYDFVEYPSLSGKSVSSIVDKMLVQHKEQLKFYPEAELWGSTLLL